MIAHRRGRVIEIAEDGRRPIRLVPRVKPAVATLLRPVPTQDFRPIAGT